MLFNMNMFNRNNYILINMLLTVLLILYVIYKIVYMTLYDLGGLEIYTQFSPF